MIIFFLIHVVPFYFVIKRLALATGSVIGIFLLWKYCCQSQRYASSDSKLWSSLSMSNKLEAARNPASSSNFSQSFAYKPLNDVVFVEKQLDENTIQVSLKFLAAVKKICFRRLISEWNFKG